MGLLNICMSFQDLLAQNGGFVGQNRGRGGAILTPNELVLPFGGFHVCANFDRCLSNEIKFKKYGSCQTESTLHTNYTFTPSK